MPEELGAKHEQGGSERSHLAVINGLRGWAVLSVLYHHVAAVHFTPIGFAAKKVGKYWLSPYALASNGWLGVNLFFLLSGFVLMLPYARGERTMASRRDALRYYLRRARRLLPLYYLVILVTMYFRPLQRFSSHEFLLDFVSHMTLTFTFQRRLFFTWYDPVLWSLAVEFWFSVVFPLLVVAWKRFGMGIVLGVTLPFSLAVRYYATLQVTAGAPALDALKDNLPGRLDDFVVGMALAVWFATKRPKASLVRTLAAPAVAFVLLTFAANVWDNAYHGNLAYPWAAPMNDVELAAFAILTAAFLTCPVRWLALPFTAPPLQLLGMMSYSIYVWHTIGGHNPDAGVDDTWAYLGVCFILAAVTYRFVEFPEKSSRKLFLSYPRLDPRAFSAPAPSAQPAPSSDPNPGAA